MRQVAVDRDGNNNAYVYIMNCCRLDLKQSSSLLDSIGDHEGAAYWLIQWRIVNEGYCCFVSGVK